MKSSEKADNGSFWAAEAAALYQTLQDSSCYLSKGLESMVDAIATACEAQDMDETDRLLTAVLARAHVMREEHRKSIIQAGKSLTARAKEMAELQGFSTTMKRYEKPTIIGAATIESKLLMPEPRQPDRSFFQEMSKPAPRNSTSEEFKAALKRLRASSDEPDTFLTKS